MVNKEDICRACFRSRQCVRLTLTVVALLVLSQSLSAAEQPPRLLERQPFDRVTLNAANGNEVIETLLLELPNRQVPSPLPTEGSLELRRLSEPSVLYTVEWDAIARVELYEQLLLQEAIALTSSRDLPEAFEYLDFLHRNYGGLPGLSDATAKYLQQDALAAYGKGNYEETLTILLALYDLDPQQRGLNKFVDTIAERLITQHLAARDFLAARSVLDSLTEGFPELNLSSVSTWQEKFETAASRNIAEARQAIDAEQFAEARQALRQALDILPDAAGANELLAEINRLSPQIVVAVDQLLLAPRNPLDWTSTRVAGLTTPKLLRLTGFGAEGGTYESRWVNLSSDDTGQQLDLKLNDTAQSHGSSAEMLALSLLQRADPTHSAFRADFADLLSDVRILAGNQVRIRWRRPHVRPEALLTIPLSDITPGIRPPGTYEPLVEEETPRVVAFELSKQSKFSGPETVVERYYENDETAFADLLRGEVDAIARIPSWQVARLEQTDGVVVSPYRLPSVHALLLNYENPLMGRREFRRALCYGIDRSQILSGILLGGEPRAGFRVLSAPLPAGISLTDPVGYAYDQGLQPRSYEPRLAAVLSAVARNSLAKGSPQDANEPAADDGQPTELTQPEPLVLVYPPNPTATTVCQTLKLQLEAIGIPIKLLTLAPLSDDTTPPDWDLRYAELAVWEPIVDARRLLGPNGLAGYCSSSMSLALRDVDQAKNWKEARSRLQEVHHIAFNDLPVIPLWQTVDFFAHRDSLQGVGTTPVTLYQNIADWQRVYREAGR